MLLYSLILTGICMSTNGKTECVPKYNTINIGTSWSECMSQKRRLENEYQKNKIVMKSACLVTEHDAR